MAEALRASVPERLGDTSLRVLRGDDDAIPALVRLAADAYTVMDVRDAAQLAEQEARLRQTGDEHGNVRIVAHRGGQLVGTMRWYDFTMNFRGRDVLAGGLGAVAVGFDARRRGVAADLVTAFVRAYRERGAALALLHPFRHDFYRRFGFGHGTKMNRFRVAPATLPRDGDGRSVRVVDGTAAEELAGCYERVRSRTNGLIVTTADDFRRMLGDVTLRAFAYVPEGDTVRGFLLTRPFVDEPKTPNANELRVFEPIAESPTAMRALLAFLAALSDQFRAIVVETQEDAFYAVPADPRNGSGRVVHPPAYHETNVQGAGVMYRVLDVAGALGTMHTDRDMSRKRQGAHSATLSVSDPLLPENGGTFPLYGAVGAGEATVRMDIADFSSLAVGSLRLRPLYDYGLAEVSDPHAVPALDRFFEAERPPLCTTRF